MNAEALLSQNPPGKGGRPGTWKLRVWVRDRPCLKPRRVRLGLGQAHSLFEALIRAEVVVRAMLVTGVGCDRVSFTHRQCLPCEWEALLGAIRAKIAELRRAGPGRRGGEPGGGPVRMRFGPSTPDPASGSGCAEAAPLPSPRCSAETGRNSGEPETTTELGAKREVAPRRRRGQNGR